MRETRFNLLRWFTPAALAVVAAGTILAGIGAITVVHNSFIEMEKDEADSLGEDLVSLLSFFHYDPSRWGTGDVPPDLQREILREMQNFDIVEFSIFALDGRPLLDLRSRPGAVRPPWADAQERAARGEVTLRWEAPRWWPVELFAPSPDRGVETYAPLRDGQAIVGVARVRRDLAPTVDAARRILPELLFGAALFGVAVFGALWLLVRKADGIIGSQYAALTAARAELERQNAVLEQLNVRKDEFYAICSDDLRAPIEAVREGCRRLLAIDAPTGPAARVVLEESVEQAGIALTLIDDLLELATYGHGSVEVVDLVGLAREVIAATRVMAASRGVTVELDAPAGGATADADRAALLRAMSHVVADAVRHAAAGIVRLGVSGGATIRITVDGFADLERLQRAEWPDAGRGEDELPDSSFVCARELAASCGGRLRAEPGPEGGAHRLSIELPAGVTTHASAPVTVPPR